jgi:hypothetical protein
MLACKGLSVQPRTRQSHPRAVIEDLAPNGVTHPGALLAENPQAIPLLGLMLCELLDLLHCEHLGPAM